MLDFKDGGDCINLSVFVVKKTGVTPISPIENQNHQEQMHIEPTFSNSIINVPSKNEMRPAPAVTRFDDLVSNHSSSTPSSPVQHSKKTFVVKALVEGIPKTSISSIRTINVKEMPKLSTHSNQIINIVSQKVTKFDDMASNQVTNDITKTSTSSIRTINVKEMSKESTYSDRIINIVSSKK